MRVTKLCLQKSDTEFERFGVSSIAVGSLSAESVGGDVASNRIHQHITEPVHAWQMIGRQTLPDELQQINSASKFDTNSCLVWHSYQQIAASHGEKAKVGKESQHPGQA